MKKHRHVWHHVWHGRDDIGLRCECKAVCERKMTSYEKLQWKAHEKRFNAEIKRENKVWWEFERKFKTRKKEKRVKIGKKWFTPLLQDGWKWSGYDLMSRVEKWAEKYPEDVYVCYCDDTHFTGSRIFLILHRPGPRRIWGTSAVAVTQCDGLPPKEFFLYPGHMKGIHEALGKILKLRDRYS